MKSISAVELKQLLDDRADIKLIDLRENYEREICTIESTHIPMHQVERFSTFDKNDQLVLFCKSGKRAESVANLLCTEMKFKNVFVLEGGITAWIENIDVTLENY